MVDTVKYVRRPFYVDVVQVTAENIEAVATWCDGEVRSEANGGAQYIKVRVSNPRTDRQTKAFWNDFVLYAGSGYKVYTPKAFANSFEVASEESKKTKMVIKNTPVHCKVNIVTPDE